MKKGLLSILAGALLVVGCQNYDDQFDQLENQITALSQTVAGLSQVQSDLSTLAGTVASLQSSLSGQIDTALADGLADIDAAIDQLEEATADVASSEDVAAISDAVAENQSDLDELLAQSSVFSGDVLINSIPTLDAYHSMGENLAIVNGNVTINPTAEMDSAKLQEVADVILTVTKDVTVTSAASTIPEIVFNNLSGVATLTMEQAGGYHFPALVSAASINLSDKYESTITRVNFPALTTVNSMGTDSNNNNVIEFTKATEMSFAALPRYAPGTITFKTKKGKAEEGKTASLDISALRDVDSTGEIAALNLTINGPNTVAVSSIDGKGGSLTLENVLTATVTDYDGAITVNGGVETFTSNNVVSLAGTMSDVITVDIKGVIDPNTSTDKSGPAINLDGKSDLVTLHLDGNLESVDIKNNGNVETVLLKPTLVVNNGDVDIDNNSDLETITMTGASMSGIIVNANNSLVNLTVDATYIKTLATGSTVDGSIAVTSNTDLEELTLKGASVSVLTVTGNVDLETINGTGLTSLGATAASNNVTISGNKFVASIAQDKTNATGCTSCGNLEANDLGGFTTTSGMATMKNYLALVAANTSATASVYFDTVESTTNATGVETTGETTGQNDTTVILALTAEVATAAKGEIAARRAFIVDVSAGGTFSLQKPAGTDLFSNGTTASTAGSITVNTNLDLLIADIKSAANIARFAAYDITLNAARGGNSTGTVSLVQYASGGSTATVLGQRYTTTTANAAAVSATNYGFGVDDTLTLTVGGNSVTVSPGTGGATTLTGLGDDLVAAWAAKYGTSGTASASAIATITNSSGSIAVTMLDIGTAGYGVDVNLSVGAGTVTATNAANIDYVIGSTRLESDDATTDTDVVIHVTSNDAGTILNQVSGVVSASSATSLIELTTNKLTNATDPGAGTAQPSATRSADAINAEDGSPKVVTTAAQSKTRVHWLAG
jgi:hypothetical protein